ncbi:MAG: ribosome silencing factor [Gammaproteobacteria bacterium]|nr:ribosome silencing factor [Gammaproteobacteria bacterium]MCK5091332.1 ribosome silencing factor [Gammaproteobacteria bacterium]
MNTDEMKELVISTLDDLKAVEVRVLDVQEMTSVTDIMIIASGTSNRHVKSIADNVVEAAKKNGVRPLGIEGDQASEWILVDLGDVVVHIMKPDTRDFYNLEKLWSFKEHGSVQDHIKEGELADIG